MSNWEKAYKDYKAGMKYKDIASKYDVSINTVKSWKSRKWNELEESATTDKKGAHKSKKVAHKEEVQLAVENDQLTEQQQMFCLLYLQYKFNATKAYQEAYGVSYKTAWANSYRVMANEGVKNEINRLKALLQQDIHVSIHDIVTEYIKQSFTDMTDFVNFGNSTYINDDGEENTYSYVSLKESAEVDGSLIQEVKKGKDGVSVKLYDKQRALAELAKYLDVSDGLGGDILIVDEWSDGDDEVTTEVTE